ncbi:hypothetical protein IGB42_03563 [Andreprevotia sp. IGB-42]|uniref:DUF748 domain-containing protein n=1 Tax=Andreprevotia sp. IGB-42 TaxID=2497473 RepID=UPI00135A79A3|nr:DUF748 domain-containing protein [Andreprevotia sp. IGB-42]KAF0812021.1 hypothetical protein IGB42_03563 [Andreprevotia sp. IGB-42]
MKPANLLAVLRRRTRSIALVVALILLFGIVGAWIGPWLAKPYVEQALSSVLHRQVTLGRLAFNPYTLQATVENVAVRESGQLVLGAGKTVVNLELASLWRRAPVVRELTIDAPYIRVTRLAAHRYNWSDLLEPLLGKRVAEPAHFAIYNIRVRNGLLEFVDTPLGQRHKVAGIEVDVPFVSNLPVFIDTEVAPRLAFSVDGAPMVLQGRTRPFGKHIDTTLDVTLDGLDLAAYWDYLPISSALTLQRAVVDTRMRLVFRQQPVSVLLEGDAHVRDVSLDGYGQPLLRLKRLDAVLDRVEPLHVQARLRQLAVTQPVLTVTRNAQGKFNWLTALETMLGNNAATVEKARAQKAPLLAIAQLKVTDGALDWRDALAPFQTRIDGIALQVDHFDTAADRPATVQLSLAGTDVGQVRYEGALRPAARQSSGKLTVIGAPLAALAPYYRSIVRSEPLAGTADVTASYEASLPAEGPPQLKLIDSSVRLHGFALRPLKARRPALAFKEAGLEQLSVDLASRQIGIGRAWADGLDLDTSRKRDGQFVLLSTLLPVSIPPTKGEGVGWRLNLQQAQLSNSAVGGVDETLPNPIPIGSKQIALTAGPLSWPLAGDTRVKVSGAGTHGGTYSANGGVNLQNLTGKLAVQAGQLDIIYAQPYFSRYLNISLTSGRLSAKGDLVLKGVKPLRAAYTGNVNINGFNAVDKLTGEDFLRWKSLYLNAVAANTEPFDLAVKDVALTDFYSRMILSSEGRLNLADIAASDTPVSVTDANAKPRAASTPAAAKTVTVQRDVRSASQPDNVVVTTLQLASKLKTVLPPLRIGKATFSGGHIVYTDNFIKPNYTANLTDMAGSLTGLSSVEDTRATLDLRGSVDRIAPVRISGQINPLAKDIFFDIKGGVQGYELTAASSYAEKYAGYGIEKGKLSMDVSYHIEHGKLQAQNKILLDQLTLGDKPSGSPDAIKLPVKFGLSLLTDRHGQINLQIPISGSLDDPSFSMGSVVWQAIGNVLTKVVTSPFDALASAFGDGPSFAYIPFEPGSSALEKKHYDPLTKLAESLADHPAFKLEIAGWVDPELDREGLKQGKLEKLIRAAKARDLADNAQESTDTLEVDVADYDRYLGTVYKAAQFPKPKNALGLNKSLPPEEMHNLLLANMPVSDDDLRQLAGLRAQTVKDFLKGLGVGDERVYLVKPRLDATAADGAKDKGPSTRAMFTLKS